MTKPKRIVGPLIPVKYYFKVPYTIAFISQLALGAWWSAFTRKVSKNG